MVTKRVNEIKLRGCSRNSWRMLELLQFSFNITRHLSLLLDSLTIFNLLLLSGFTQLCHEVNPQQF
jgi:hypothetical protein